MTIHVLEMTNKTYSKIILLISKLLFFQVYVKQVFNLLVSRSTAKVMSHKIYKDKYENLKRRLVKNFVYNKY